SPEGARPGLPYAARQGKMREAQGHPRCGCSLRHPHRGNGEAGSLSLRLRYSPALIDEKRFEIVLARNDQRGRSRFLLAETLAVGREYAIDNGAVLRNRTNVSHVHRPQHTEGRRT